MLGDIAGAPGRPGGAQHKVQLRIVLAGKLVQLAGAEDFVQHVGQLHANVQAVGKGLHFGDKFGKLNLIERAQPVGQLHPGLQLVVALTGAHDFPLAAEQIAPLHLKQLAACAAGGGLRLQDGLSGQGLLQGQLGNGIEQGIQLRADGRRQHPRPSRRG